MFIEREANTGFSSVAAAYAPDRCRSYGAKMMVAPNSYKYCAPTEREELA